MRVEQVAIYDGPNRWAKLPLVRVRLDFEDPPSNSGEAWNGCVESLLALLPSIVEPWRATERAQPEASGDPALRLALLTAVIAIQLQREVGPDVRFAQARRLSRDRLLYDLVYEQEDARAAVPAGRLAAGLVLEAAQTSALLPGTPRRDRDPQESIGRYLAAAPDVVLDQTTRAMARAAERRGIPWRRVDPASRKVQLGHGCRLAHMMETVTSNCTAIASSITGDKSLNNRLLSRLGLPVARHAVVDDPQRALAAARQIGYPLVVKPSGGGQGKGVTVGIETEEALLRAVQEAQRFHKLVMIEGFVSGKDHRLLVVAGRFLAGAQRVPGGVTGNGRHSVAELVEIANRDPRRGLRFQKLMTFLEMNPEAERILAAAGLTPESVPEEGQWVALRRTANISTGGTAIDVTDGVHPDNRAMAERAARAVGLDVAGIDFLTPDITRSYREVGGAILEVNRSPGLRPHWLANPEQDVVSPILETLFPPGDDGRIPLAAITGTNGKTTTALMVERIVARGGRRVGLASTSGVRLDGHWIASEDLAGYPGHLAVLSAREVQVAVLEAARGGMAKRGLGYDRATVGAVLNVTEDHLGLDDIATLDEMATVKRLVIETASGTAVLNAEDPRCVAMADRSVAERLCYVALDPENPVFAAHVSAGGPGASLQKARGRPFVTLFEGHQSRPLIAVEDVPATFAGRARFNIQNALFAAAIAAELGANDHEIADGLASFDSSFESNPGRFNLRDIDGFRIAVDYAHNEAKFRAVAELVSALDVTGRRICAFCAAGDRDDVQLGRMASALASPFDRFLVFESKNLRGRSQGSVPEVLAQALVGAGVAPERIARHANSADAIATLLSNARPGDFALLIADDIYANWRQVAAWPGSAKAG